MSTREELKEYLLGKDEAIGYLLNDDNNGKTVMLSGAWGSGKTHFWQNEIAREQKKIEVNGETHDKYTKEEYEDGLSYKLKEKKKSCVYISLYGKDSLSELKKEVLFRASTESDYLSDDIEAFGFNALATIDEVGGAISAIYKVASNMNESRRDKKGTNKLKDGGIICFDDFERKSKNIDLNDLFGFISQLAIGLNCKIVIILNSDVFEGEEANVFKTVKEKTVNKYFYFEPTIEELFKFIYDSNAKYKKLNDYKDEIFKAIIETREKNARIYIQVLDNCLEWIDQYEYNRNELRALVLITTNFIKNHFVFSYKILPMSGDPKLYSVLEKYYKNEGLFEISNYFIKIVPQLVNSMTDEEFKAYFEGDRTIAPIGTSCGCEEFLHLMHSSISKKEEDSNGKFKSDSYYEKLDKVFHANKDIFYALNYYAYVLKIENGISEDMFAKINQFVKTGILPKNPKEVESSLLLKAN